jgi:hypothetical protein
VGLLLWQYFSGTLTNASNSMIANAGIIQNVYFPRLIIPAATAVTGLVDLAASYERCDRLRAGDRSFAVGYGHHLALHA